MHGERPGIEKYATCEAMLPVSTHTVHRSGQVLTKPLRGAQSKGVGRGFGLSENMHLQPRASTKADTLPVCLAERERGKEEIGNRMSLVQTSTVQPQSLSHVWRHPQTLTLPQLHTHDHSNTDRQTHAWTLTPIVKYNPHTGTPVAQAP